MHLTWVLLATTVAAVWSVPHTPVSVRSVVEASITPEFKASLAEALSLGDESSRNTALEEMVLGLLETLRQTILEGSGIIPPLDPLEIPSIELDDQIIPLPGTRVALKEAKVANLATFVVDNLTMNMISLLQMRYRVFLDIRIPNLDISAKEYELELSALGYNIFGAGSLKLSIVDPTIKANMVVSARLSGGIFLTIEESNIQFELSAFKPELTGVFGHQGVSDFVNLFLADLVPTLVVTYEPEITEFLSTNVMEFGNSILGELDLGGLISP